MDKLLDYHVPQIAKLICKCGKEMYLDIQSGKYVHVGERVINEPKQWSHKYSRNDPNASWNNPK